MQHRLLLAMAMKRKSGHGGRTAKAAKTTQIVVVDAAEGNDLVLIWAMSAEANLFQAIAVQISKSFTWKSSFCVVKAWLRQLPLFKWVGAKL